MNFRYEACCDELKAAIARGLATATASRNGIEELAIGEPMTLLNVHRTAEAGQCRMSDAFWPIASSPAFSPAETRSGVSSAQKCMKYSSGSGWIM